MTTIAYRDGVLAADGLVTERGLRVGSTSKIACIGAVAWGVCGTLIAKVAVDDWIRGGLRGDMPAMKTPEGATSTAIIIVGQRLVTIDEHGIDHMPLPEFHAIGSGDHLALGAMAAGCGAVEAVKAAAKLDLSTGGEISVLRIPANHATD